MGTPVYMAPGADRRQGGGSTRSDIYALGLILTEMTTGKRSNERKSEGLPPEFAIVS